MLHRRSRPIVFGGPSLELVAPQTLSRLDVRPPICRGNLESLFQMPRPGTVLILDGVFGYQLAVTVTECRRLLEKGWLVVGASSMGALRAADLWSKGMLGIGEIYTMFRLGFLRSDADVAVVYGGLQGEESTASVAHVRAVLGALEDEGLIDGVAGRSFLSLARNVHWTRRVWPGLIDVWIAAGLSDDAAQKVKLTSADPLCHPKKRDGLVAVHSLLAGRWIHRTSV